MPKVTVVVLIAISETEGTVLIVNKYRDERGFEMLISCI